ncbi:MAG: hypothetical protein ACFUZC_04790 [Chthoniobacteraceae bacterium]
MHEEAPTSPPLFDLWGYPVAFAHILVAGGLAYSAKTVYQWGLAVFADRFKAIGFTLLVEGVLTFGRSGCLVFPALGILALINSISATSRLAETDYRPHGARREKARKAGEPRGVVFVAGVGDRAA